MPSWGCSHLEQKINIGVQDKVSESGNYHETKYKAKKWIGNEQD